MTESDIDRVEEAPNGNYIKKAAQNRAEGAGVTPALDERIARKASIYYPRFRGIYLKAMGGHSLRAGVKAFCLDCLGQSPDEIARCTCPTCPLYPYRPYRPKREANP